MATDDAIFDIVYYTDDNGEDYEYREERYSVQELLELW